MFETPMARSHFLCSTVVQFWTVPSCHIIFNCLILCSKEALVPSLSLQEIFLNNGSIFYNDTRCNEHEQFVTIQALLVLNNKCVFVVNSPHCI